MDGLAAACRASVGERNTTMNDSARLAVHPTGVTFEQWLSYQPWVAEGGTQLYTADTVKGAWVAGSQCNQAAALRSAERGEVAIGEGHASGVGKQAGPRAGKDESLHETAPSPMASSRGDPSQVDKEYEEWLSRPEEGIVAVEDSIARRAYHAAREKGEAERKALETHINKLTQYHTDLLDNLSAVKQRAERAEAANKALVDETLERAAKVCDEITYALDISDWHNMTKKEHSAYACRQCAAAIRALRSQP